MYPEFAYSGTMQLILVGVSFIHTFIFVYFIANLILQLYGEEVTFRQKSIFAFWVGIVLDCAWIYAVYLIGGMVSFSDTVYLLVVTANPILAMVYYFIGIKVLNLSPIRSIKLMGYIYMYFVTAKILSRIIGLTFFVQQPGRYNYMLDALYCITFLSVFLGIYLTTQYFLKRNKPVIKLRDNLFINKKKELAIYFAKATFMYLFAVGFPLLISERIVANIVVFVIFSLSLALTIMCDLYRATKNEAENNVAHIEALTKEVLTVYMKETVDLEEKINENPSLISTLIRNREYAKTMNVKLKIELNSNIRNLYIDNVDACRMIDCILENAIDAAAVSEEKWVSFTVEAKAKKKKLFIVYNSMDTPSDAENTKLNSATDKRQHYSRRLAEVYRIIVNYGNCIFHFEYGSNGMLTYLETKQNCLRRFFPVAAP